MKFLIILLTLGLFENFAEADIQSSFKFKFYESLTSAKNYNQSSLPLVLQNPSFSSSKPSVLYIYGLTQNPEVESVYWIRYAYVSAGWNFILFDVDTVDHTFLNLDVLSDKIADSVIALFNAGFNRQYFDVVGFSLGAQLAGYVGRKIQIKSAEKYILPRIVALEPAILSPVNLRTSDASFVMTVHTGNVLSDPSVIGHVAFYPNGGEAQPMCRKSIFLIPYDDFNCGHGQVQLYWAEAVFKKVFTAFAARKCNNVNDFNNKACNQSISLGYLNPGAPSTLRGNYYFSTNLAYPFDKGVAGANI